MIDKFIVPVRKGTGRGYVEYVEVSVKAPTVDASESDGALKHRVSDQRLNDYIAYCRFEDENHLQISGQVALDLRDARAALARSSLPDAGEGTQGAQIKRVRVFKTYESCERTTFYVELTNSRDQTLTPHAFATGSVYTEYVGLSIEEARDRALMEASEYADFFGVNPEPYVEGGITVSPSMTLGTYRDVVLSSHQTEACDNQRTPLSEPEDGCWYPIEQCSMPHCDCEERNRTREARDDEAR